MLKWKDSFDPDCGHNVQEWMRETFV